MKQLDADPWEGVELKYPIGTKFIGRVGNITDYGAFVELEPGVEGARACVRNELDEKECSSRQDRLDQPKVDVMVLEVDSQKRRISLGLKQCARQSMGRRLRPRIRLAAMSKARLKTSPSSVCSWASREIDGMVHLSDAVVGRQRRRSREGIRQVQMVTARVLDIDVEKERISLGVKQLSEDPLSGAIEGIKKGDTVFLHGDGRHRTVGVA